jgi:hypothetical protein
MPLQTRNIAKGVPPRVHLHKSTKHKPSASKKDGATKAALTKKGHKRHASTSGDESEGSEQSEDLELKARKKKRARQELNTSEGEPDVEEVDDDPVLEPPMEHIDDVPVDNDEQSEQGVELDEVSTNNYITRRMNLLTI